MSGFKTIMLLDEAEDDLDDAYVWYEMHKPVLGASFVLEVVKIIQSYPGISNGISKAI